MRRRSASRDDESAYGPPLSLSGNPTVPCTPVSVPAVRALRFGLNVSTCQRDTQPRRRKFTKLLEFMDSNKHGKLPHLRHMPWLRQVRDPNQSPSPASTLLRIANSLLQGKQQGIFPVEEN